MGTLVRNLRFAHKFILISVLALLMLAVPTYFFVDTNLSLMSTARQEVLGLQPIQDLMKLTQLTQQHRGMSAVLLSGNDSQANARIAKESEINAALAKAKASLNVFEAKELESTMKAVEEEWKALSVAVATKSIAGPQSFSRHTALIAAQLLLAEDVVNVSGISLDPSAAGYHLHIAVLHYMPQVTEVLGQIRARGAAILARGTATAEDKVRIEVLGTSIRSNMAAARKSFGLAAAANPQLNATLGEALANAGKATEAGLRLADEKIVRAEALTFASPEYFAAMTQTIDVQFVLINAAFEALRSQLMQALVDSQRALLVSAGVIGALLAGVVWIMILITRTTTTSVGKALSVAQAVASGDLSTHVEIRGRDEIGELLQSLDAMQTSLIQVVSKVRQGSESVANASAEIAQGNNDMSARTESQASALQQTAASMTELSSTVKQNADSAREANRLAQTASTVAARGGEVVGQVVQTMKGINDSSHRIADIIQVIDGIAFQTNILALNAAVEAARAGEQGRGFAVVASEVRSLAGRSADAAKEIKTLINASVTRVEQGAAQVDLAGATMAEVVQAITQVTSIMAEISTASSEQALGVEQVGAAVSQMDEVTQQNAALVEQMAAAASGLKNQASELVEAVSVFQVDTRGTSASQPSSIGFRAL